MKTNKYIILMVSVFIALLIPVNFAIADDAPWFTEQMKNNEAVLSPGTNTYCDKSFQVENMGKDMAEVQIILGNGDNYLSDTLMPNAKAQYSLTPGTPFASENGGGVQINDARIVNTGNEPLKIRCK